MHVCARWAAPGTKVHMHAPASLVDETERHRPTRAGDFLENPTRVGQEPASFRPKPHARRGSIEQRCAELVFEKPDLTRQRGLTDVYAGCGSTDVPLFSNRDEVLDLGQAHSASLQWSNAECTWATIPF